MRRGPNAQETKPGACSARTRWDHHPPEGLRESTPGARANPPRPLLQAVCAGPIMEREFPSDPQSGPLSQVPGRAGHRAPPGIFRTYQGISRSVLGRRHLARLHILLAVVIRGEQAARGLLAQAPPLRAEGGVMLWPLRSRLLAGTLPGVNDPEKSRNSS
jgi:hypothetical protein